MTEIEQLRKDIEQAKEIMFRFYKQDRQALGIGEMYDRLAKLEAEAAAKADPWKRAKVLAGRWLVGYASVADEKIVATYVCHLECRVAELEEELRCERIDGGKVHADLKARIAGLEAELARRPVVYCMKNNLTGIYGKHFGLDRIALFDIENPEVLADWQSEPYTGEQS